MRKNHPKAQTRMDTYDRVYIDLPDEPGTARAIVIPMKTIFINTAADWNANIDRMFWNIEDAEEFFERQRILP